VNRTRADEPSSCHCREQDYGSADWDELEIFSASGSPPPSLSKAFRYALDRLCTNGYVLAERVILIHAPGTRFPTTELDLLVVTPFGVFVVTAVRHHGTVLPGPDLETLNVVDIHGETLIRTSPARRQASAIRCLRPLLGQHECPVQGLAVAVDLPCTLHPLLPESILEAPELYHWLRLRMIRFITNGQRHVNVRRALDAIATRLDSRLEALDEHRARVCK
jgi:Nuclease-related domain